MTSPSKSSAEPQVSSMSSSSVSAEPLLGDINENPDGTWFRRVSVEIEKSSITALIPTAFGAILLACAGGVKNQNKIIAHIAVLLTLLILFALLGMRLPKSLESGGIGLFRVLFMCGTSLLAMIYFVKSFIAARKK